MSRSQVRVLLYGCPDLPRPRWWRRLAGEEMAAVGPAGQTGQTMTIEQLVASRMKGRSVKTRTVSLVLFPPLQRLQVGGLLFPLLPHLAARPRIPSHGLSSLPRLSDRRAGGAAGARLSLLGRRWRGPLAGRGRDQGR